MSLYVKTLGKASLAIAVCDRCQMKFPCVDLDEDRNSPGLLVCAKCNDALDPYRLPVRAAEDASVRRPRPEDPLT
jgi:hypothetical protein